MLPCISELSNKFNELSGISADNANLCTLELTVTTGLEEVAAQECREKLNVTPITYLGRIIFDISIDNVSEVLKLRSIENVNHLIFINSDIQFSKEREECFGKLYKLVNSPDWRKGIRVWQSVFGVTNEEDPFKGEVELKGSFCTPKPEVDLKLMKNDSSISGNLPASILSSILNKAECKSNTGNVNKENETANVDSKLPGSNNPSDAQRRFGGPKFRVTAHRVGAKHIFGSSEAARQFGGGINEKFGWPVDLTNFDIEILLNIIGDFVYVAISLTKEPLFKRNLSVFGPTNLRSTICYNMIKLAKPQPGDFIVDPMCGGGSVPIEGALTYPHCFYLGGDNFEAATERSKTNIENLVKKGNSMNIDTIRWDSTSLPFRDQVVDVVVCDLPFGKRIGSKVDNRVLYFKSLIELARVTRLNTGRAVLLTYDKRSIGKCLLRVSSLWKNFSTRSINIGGLLGAVYLLQRTGLLGDPNLKESKDDFTFKGKKRKLSVEKE